MSKIHRNACFGGRCCGNIIGSCDYVTNLNYYKEANWAIRLLHAAIGGAAAAGKTDPSRHGTAAAAAAEKGTVNHMKQRTLKGQRLAGALLSAALLAVSTVPAGAVESAGQAAAQASQNTTAPTVSGMPVTIKEMGLTAVERAVRENNATVRSLQNIASSIDTVSDIADQYAAQGGLIQVQIENYKNLIAGLEAAMEGVDPSSDLYKTYAAQKKLLEENLQSLQMNELTIPIQQQSYASAIDDAVYDLRRQAANVADQLAMGAQDMLIGIKTLQNAETGLNRQLAQLDRTIGMMETTLRLGLASQYEMDATRHARENLAVNITTLETQRENLAGSLALMCGLDASTLVMPSVLPVPSSTEMGKMKYEADLASALDNSFSIWQKKCDLRDAQNRYDSAISGTAEAVAGAQDALAAEKITVESAFLTAYQTVRNCRTTLAATETALRQAELDFSTAELQYKRGMISHLDYLKAQDALASAQDAVASAGLELTSAFNKYQWAKQGLV